MNILLKWILMLFLARMQWVVTKYQTTAKCSYKYTLTISFLNINGSWNIHQILLQNISILTLTNFLSFFTSSANTLLILRLSQDMAGFCACVISVCVLHWSDTVTLYSWGWNAMLAGLSCKKPQIYLIHVQL